MNVSNEFSAQEHLRRHGRFCGLKRINNALIVKLAVSEVDFHVLHSKDWTNLANAAYLEDLIFSGNLELNPFGT